MKPGQSVRLLRLVLLSSGLLLLSLAVLSDWLGIGLPDGIGRGQTLLVLVGAGLAASGLLWRRFPRTHNTLALILLNTAVLLCLLELGVIAAARLGLLSGLDRNLTERYQHLPYYAAQDWTETYWVEAQRAESYRYMPFTGWRHRPFQGQTVNIDTRGRRLTPGGECASDSYRIFTFGGSTMWGWGSPDWETIPAHLQTALSRELGRTVCVQNYAEDAYVSTQSVIELIHQLQEENLPDLAIFYSGVNDVFAAFRSGQAGQHTALEEMIALYETPANPTVRWVKSSRLYWLIDTIMTRRRASKLDHFPQKAADRTRDGEVEELAAAIVSTYLANYRLVEALAREYDFSYAFFWQPHLAAGHKKLTQEEEVLRSSLPRGLTELTRATYRRLAARADALPGLWDLSNVFDAESSQIWIDDWNHVTPEGNRLVASRIVAAVLPALTAGPATESDRSPGPGDPIPPPPLDLP